MFFRIFLMLVLFYSASSTFAEGDPAAGRLKAETCLGCHAVTGYYNVYPTYHVPKLGGQSAGYIESALKAYRSGTRTHGPMQANASDLSNEDIADIAAFMASHK
jgi:cytochrome c553